jgi:hypothetical protein
MIQCVLLMLEAKKIAFHARRQHAALRHRFRFARQSNFDNNTSIRWTENWRVCSANRQRDSFC